MNNPDFVKNEENWIMKEYGKDSESERLAGGVLCAVTAFNMTVDIYIPISYAKRHVKVDEN